MQLRVNGERREVADNLSLQELVKTCQLNPEQIAVELNHHVVRRAEWASTVLKEDDSIEIVHFVGGGDHLSFVIYHFFQRVDRYTSYRRTCQRKEWKPFKRFPVYCRSESPG